MAAPFLCLRCCRRVPSARVSAANAGRTSRRRSGGGHGGMLTSRPGVRRQPSACQTKAGRRRRETTVPSPWPAGGSKICTTPIHPSTATATQRAGKSGECSQAHLEAKGVARPAPFCRTGAQPPQPLYQYRRRPAPGPIHQRIEHLVVARRRHGEQLLMASSWTPATSTTDVRTPGMSCSRWVSPSATRRRPRSNCCAMALSISLSPGPFRRILT